MSLLLLLNGNNGGAAPPAPTYATWNTADKAAAITISNNDLTAASSGGWWGARATIGVTDGDWFFEQVIDVADNASTYTGVGVCTSSQGLTFPGDNSGNGWGIISHGYNTNPGGVSSNGVSLSPGDVVGVSILRSTSRAKFYKLVAGSWSLVYNADISSVDGQAIYPMFATLGGQGTANFGPAPFADSVPDGANEGVYTV